MKNINSRFKPALLGHNIADLDAHSGAIYGLWPDFKLAYLNPAWFCFARENGGEPRISAEWGLGKSVLTRMPPQLKKVFKANLKECLRSGKPWNHEYECSSATIYRKYHQIVYPLAKQEGLLIVNSLLVERPHDPKERPPRTADRSLYVDEKGFVCQCAYCRRVKNFKEVNRWDWVPEWVKRFPEATSHSYCPTCFAHYFPAKKGG